MTAPKRRFVFCRLNTVGGWWLKIDTLECLLAWHEHHNGTYGRAFQNILYGKEFNSQMPDHGPNPKEMPLSQAIWYHAANRGISPIQSVMDISSTILSSQVDALRSGPIYVNDNGGWCPHLPAPVVAFADRDGFSFPSYGRSDIRVTKFPGGEHYYAHVGAVEVRDGDVIKWPTYREAYEHALAFTNAGDGDKL